MCYVVLIDNDCDQAAITCCEDNTQKVANSFVVFAKGARVLERCKEISEVYISCRKLTDETIQFLADAKKEFEAGLGKAYWIALADHPSQDGVEDGKPGEAYHCLLCSFKCLTFSLISN